MLKYTGITGIKSVWLAIITKFLVVGPFEKIENMRSMTFMAVRLRVKI